MEWQWFLFLIPATLIGGLVTLLIRLPRGRINPRFGAPHRRTNRSSDTSSIAADGASGEGSGHHTSGDHGGSSHSGGGDSSSGSSD